jgi:hypothetical protein
MPRVRRDEASAILREGQERLDGLLDGLTEAELVRPATIGGGDWSAKDLIGHMALWEEIALVTIDAWLGGRKPRIEEAFTPGDTDALNAWNHERKLAWPAERVRADSGETHRRLLSSIDGMTDDDWATPRPFEGDEQEDLGSELGGVLGAPGRAFGHAFAHLPDLEAYVRSVRG